MASFRWGRLLVALAMVIVEWVCRWAITVFFRVIPLVCGDTPLSDEKNTIDDPDWERSTLEFVEAKGYRCEEHFVTTPDGYILGLHRIPAVPTTQADGADAEEEPPSLSSLPSPPSPICPVLIVHGFMQSSEAFAIRQQASDSLPLVLSEAGYDVWLGNNRGNKYSHKHVHKKPTHEDFWDYSLDDLARFDLPTMIDHVLAQTGAKSLTLIGFSQGTAQSFAYLSSHSSSHKVNLFVALAPVSVPRGLANPIVDSLIRARPDFIFLLFGKKQLLPSTLFWRSFLPRAQFVKMIDFSLRFLFGWTTECLSESEKPLLYSHLYSHTSVKTVVQWFQMIQSSKFQMFDDYNAAPAECYSGYTLPQYQLGHIRTPVACFCGGRDTLPLTPKLVSALPKDQLVLLHNEERYEHLDFMWAKDLSQTVFPKILSLMEKFARRKEDDRYEL